MVSCASCFRRGFSFFPLASAQQGKHMHDTLLPDGLKEASNYTDQQVCVSHAGKWLRVRLHSPGSSIVDDERNSQTKHVSSLYSPPLLTKSCGRLGVVALDDDGVAQVVHHAMRPEPVREKSCCYGYAVMDMLLWILLFQDAIPR